MTEIPKNLIQTADTPETLYGFSRRAANEPVAPPAAVQSQQQQPANYQTTLIQRGTRGPRSAAEEQRIREAQQRGHSDGFGF